MMLVARTIEPQDWMRSAQAAAVMAALDGTGDSPQALFVGGCVRNTLLGRRVDDIDIATRLHPDDVTARLVKAGIAAVPTGVAHGTITAVADGRSFEITTLRRDVETDGRHAVIAFSQDWAEDAARRDFTMNTLLADRQGHIYDPTGQGLADLEAGRVAFVGDPARRIAEDYLRILRFFRFYACYGAGAPDPTALAACYAAADRIGTLSRERITQEFLKILAAPDPARVLGLMFAGGVMGDLPRPGYDPEQMNRLACLQDRHLTPDPVARLALLIETPEDAEKYLILSNRQKSALLKIRQAVSGPAGVRQLVYFYGADIAAQALLIRAVRRGEDDAPDLAFARSWQPPAFLLGGEDVMAAGVPAGPEVGQLLKEVESWWLARDLAPGRTACLDYLKSLLQGH